MTKIDSITGKFSIRNVVLVTAVVGAFFVFYLDGVGENPAGFYIDESAISYNAFLISQTGRNEYGELLPAYFRAFPKADGTFEGYINPTYIYALAAVNVIVPPSVVLSRTFSSCVVFFACVLLGLLAWKISNRPAVGMIISFSALLNPWLFELSRLVFETTLYPLVLVLFLLALFHAQQTGKWTWLDCVALAGGLALTTYTYSIGRLLGPLLGLGLLFFAINKQGLFAILRIFALYAFCLIPAGIFAWRNPGAMTGHYSSLSYFTDEMGSIEKLSAFMIAYLHDIGPENLLMSGDPFLRHHVPATGMLFAATILIAMVGILMSVWRSRSDPWYRFLLFGLAVSVVPGALTQPRAHMLRLIAFPIFVLLISVPFLEWLLNGWTLRVETELRVKMLRSFINSKILRFSFLIILMAGLAAQAGYFQREFRERGPGRNYLFDLEYPEVFAEAVASEQRPIYLEDGFWGPAYMHAYFYGAAQGIDRSQFIHLTQRERPPAGTLVLSSNDKCLNCTVIMKKGNFLLYRPD